MKKKLALVLSILLMLLVTACSSGTGAGKPAETTPSQEGAVPPPADGIVAYVGGTIFDGSLDPVKGAMSYGYSFTNCALLRVNPDSNYEGDMATDWSISDDSLVYTYKLRENVRFSDGSDFTADDVVFTYTTVKENQAHNENVDLTKLASVKALNDYTVEFTLSEPYSPFLDTTACLGIVPSDSYDSKKFDQYPIGTGAWIVTQYDANQQIIVTANENYYEGAPAIKKVTFVSMNSEAAFSNAKSGQLDIVMIGPNYTSEKVAHMTTERFETMDIRMINLPVLKEQTMKNPDGKDIKVGNNVTSDINVRKALAIGIDRQTIINHAFNGVGKPAVSFTANLQWASTDTYADNRKVEASALLQDAGWVDTDGDGIREKNGLKCEFDVYAPGSDNDRFLLANAVAEDALKLGVKINVKTASWDEVANLQSTSGIVWGWGQYSPTVLNSLFNSQLFLKGAYDNVSGYANPQVDADIQKAFTSTTHDGAVAAWKAVQATANQDYPYLYIVNIEHCYLVKDSLDLSLDTQIAHPHGHGSPIICNMKDWNYK
ncbi:Oligopeptide-binding protein AppA [bioreactor metagenome]|uniref:Oligopeptide-binding protein AppA n=1 Tax=bioreactor metagenome TaxID=1076179 RepID=A0A644UMV4_9ZZZZ|nr:ABC transporter substrate-binding protein [Desulfitobacterium hafniense]MEA5023685.1 ABC transporter substrate-binding protein [Desulfitobacterium hafniense]